MGTRAPIAVGVTASAGVCFAKISPSAPPLPSHRLGEPRARDICEQHHFYRALVHVLSQMSDYEQAIEILVVRLRDIKEVCPQPPPYRSRTPFVATWSGAMLLEQEKAMQ